MLGVAQAASVTLTWDLNDPAEKVKGYKLCWGNYSGNSRVFPFKAYTTVALPPVTVQVSELQKWYFRMAAFNEWGESLYSNVVEVFFIRTPKNLKFQRIDVR